MKLKLRPALLTALAVLSLASPACAREVTVFAAASLTDSLKEIATAYGKLSGDRIAFNFGASSMLARQIEAGAPADIFFSADEAKMDAVQEKDLILKGTRKSRLSNTLVIVVAADSQLRVATPEDLTGPLVKRLALADPRGVPAGIYSREFLEKRQLWSAVERKVIPTENVRAALAAVESGNVDAGMVYRTDAAISKKVKVACEVPPKEGPAISYPLAILKGSRNVAAAERFRDYLNSPEASQVFRSYGFIVLK